MARPGSGVFAPSSAVALRVKLRPAVTVVGGSTMSTAATRGGSTGITMLARASSSAAVIRTVPGARPAIAPCGVTAAIAGSADCQVTLRDTGQPRLSCGVASSRISSPA